MTFTDDFGRLSKFLKKNAIRGGPHMLIENNIHQNSKKLQNNF